MSFLKIVIYVPVTHADKIRATLAKAGAGHIGNYDSCSFSVRGVGRFRGLEGSHPAIGQPGRVEEVEEERIETACEEKNLGAILEEVKKVHPYEEPAIDVYPTLNEKYLR
jgi:hypothetical protein